MPKGDVIDLLLEQHSQIELLFIELSKCQYDSRRELFQELARLLAVHEAVEEQLIHPLARTVDEADGVDIDARLGEEQEAKILLEEMLDNDDYASSGFPEHLATLRTAVLSHATREQRYEFPRLRARYGPQLKMMVPLMLAAQKVAPTRPHPGVELASDHLMSGPFSAIADRVKDALRDAKEEESPRGGDTA